jgi:hypothetical protein
MFAEVIYPLLVVVDGVFYFTKKNFSACIGVIQKVWEQIIMCLCLNSANNVIYEH